MQRNILIFIPTLTIGGAERVASILANEWSSEHRVNIVTYFAEPVELKLNSQVVIHCMGYKANRNTLMRNLDVMRALFSFRRMVVKLKPDFVLSFMNKYNVFALGALQAAGIPIIVSERDSPVESLPRVTRSLRRKLYPRAAGVICQTNGQLDFIRAISDCRNVCAIPNPISRQIDPNERVPRRRILNVARHDEKKGLDHLLRAFAAMKQPGWDLVLCGDGPKRDALVKLAGDLGIADRVHFKGTVRDLSPLHSEAGIFAFSSLWEGFPNALGEAMVSGIPCVSYDCPTGPADLIEDGVNGRLVQVGDWLYLAHVLDELASNPIQAITLGKRAAELYEQLNTTAIANRYLTFCIRSAD